MQAPRDKFKHTSKVSGTCASGFSQLISRHERMLLNRAHIYAQQGVWFNFWIALLYKHSETSSSIPVKSLKPVLSAVDTLYQGACELKNEYHWIRHPVGASFTFRMRHSFWLLEYHHHAAVCIFGLHYVIQFFRSNGLQPATTIWTQQGVWFNSLLALLCKLQAYQ